MVEKLKTDCTNCNSDNVIRGKQPGVAMMLSLMLFFVPIPFFCKGYFCFEWKNE
tara:strand:- start:15062 stop:15223 length:162 start_codon:yes stop_codon:yes gene_type:complete